MPAQKHILVLGGGFGGVYTIIELQRLWQDDPAVRITLVSRHNYFLMTPLLFEAGSGVLEPRHTVNPIRPICKTARFIEAEIESIHLDRKVVAIRRAQHEPFEISYDILVLALGGVTNTHIVPGSEHARSFKTLADAIALRNHVIHLFELADAEPDPAAKARMLSFVLIGGGLVNVELCGELTVFLSRLVGLYPRISQQEIRVEMIEGGPAVAREFDEDLRDYVAQTLRSRGVTLTLNTLVKQIEPDKVLLPDGRVIASDTILLGAGVSPSPLVSSLPLEKDKKGRAITDPTMLCKGQRDVWALGDCAQIPDPTGKPYPELAQHALREARLLARNITASLRNQPLTAFVYKTKGTLAALGHSKGVGKIYNLEIRGFFAWWVWRTYYLMQMHGWSRRLRVVLDWTIALLFKNDIVQLEVVPKSAAKPPDTAH